MNTQLIHITSLSAIVYVLCGVFLLACQLHYRALPSRIVPFGAEDRIQMDYEAETYSTMRVAEIVPEHVQHHYGQSTVPVVSRNRVQVRVDRYGEVFWYIVNLEPELKWGNKATKKRTQVKKTIFHGRFARFYDDDGRELYAGPALMPDLEQINRFVQSALPVDLTQKMAAAKENGSTVQEFPNGNVAIWMWKSMPVLDNSDAIPVQIMELYDGKGSRLVATGMYDETGQVLEEHNLLYSELDNALVHIKSETWHIDAKGLRVVHTNDTYFKYLHVVIGKT